MSETTTPLNPVLKTIQLVTQIALQGNMATAAIFEAISVIRANWPHHATGETPPSDEQVIAMMKAEFEKNRTRNAELIDAILAGNPQPPAA